MTTAITILILLLMFIFAAQSVILSMTKQGRHEGYDIEPCPLIQTARIMKAVDALRCPSA